MNIKVTFQIQLKVERTLTKIAIPIHEAETRDLSSLPRRAGKSNFIHDQTGGEGNQDKLQVKTQWCQTQYHS